MKVATAVRMSSVAGVELSLRWMRLAMVIAAASTMYGCTDIGEDRGDVLATTNPSRIGLELAATGFFVDDHGSLLTADHAATNCAQLYVIKEGRTVGAQLIAEAPEADLALLKVPETLGLSGVFADTVQPAANDMVFTSGYDALQDVLARGGGLFNAVITDANATGANENIELVSDATYGASGAPILNANGLVIGILTRRESVDHVLATNAHRIKAFLTAHRIAFEQDDRPQVSALQDRAHRAETISAHVLCFKRG